MFNATTKNKVNRFLWQKWGSFFAIVSLSGAAPFSLFWLGILVVSNAVLLYLGALALSAIFVWMQIVQRRNKTLIESNQRELNLHHPHEREMASIIKKLAKKARISPPIVTVQLSKRSAPFLGAHANSWPYPNQIIFSEDLLTIYGKSFSRKTFAAKMAHEISHIQHQDARYETVLKIFKITVLLTCIISLCIIFTSSILPVAATLLVGTIALGSEFFFCLWNRAKETLADINAVYLTRQPQSVINFLYDKYYQLLYFGRLGYERKNGGEKIWRFDDQKSIENLKRKHRQLRPISRKKIYASLKKDAKALKSREHQRQRQSTSILWRYSSTCYRKLSKFASSWFDDYPRCHEREAVVLSIVPKGFIRSKRLY